MPNKTPLSRQIVLSLCIAAALGVMGLVLSRQGRSETHAAAPAAKTESVEVSSIGQKVDRKSVV